MQRQRPNALSTAPHASRPVPCRPLPRSLTTPSPPPLPSPPLPPRSPPSPLPCHPTPSTAPNTAADAVTATQRNGRQAEHALSPLPTCPYRRPTRADTGTEPELKPTYSSAPLRSASVCALQFSPLSVTEPIGITALPALLARSLARSLAASLPSFASLFPACVRAHVRPP